ncbi:MAG: PIG-L family deacetylase [gamma proteobacterium symbiont of Taylorina sp.]|nr:PIG-L family deacetylase [gamma proteobacterium symbiont of Taylorina sp.]
MNPDKKNIVLTIAAHPDDEVLGCGATMAKHSAQGDLVYVLLIADGETSRVTISTPNRNIQANEAAKILGINKVFSLNLADQRLDTIALLDIVHKIESVIEEIKPDIIYTHFANDLNLDHQIVNRAVLTACRPLPGSLINSIFTFETQSSTEWSGIDETAFKANHIVDVSGFMKKKIEALHAYGSEMRDFPHSRSYEALDCLAKLRGAQAGLQAAECFQIERQMWR